MMNEPGLSMEKPRPLREGPLTTVASVMEARRLTSPALSVRVAEALLFSNSYLALTEAFIIANGGGGGRRVG